MHTTSKFLQSIDTFQSLPTFAPSIIIISLRLLALQHLDSISIYAAPRVDLLLLETNQLRHFFLPITAVYITTLKRIVSLSRHPLPAKLISRRTPFHQIPLSSYMYQHSLSSPYTRQINFYFGSLRNNFLASHFQVLSTRHRQNWDEMGGSQRPFGVQPKPCNFCLFHTKASGQLAYSHILHFFASGEYIFIYT
jgi:hypothetical protein